MQVIRLARCAEFLAGDHTRLRELLHPAKSGTRVAYSLAWGRLEPGARSKRHRLASSEVYYVLSGHGTFYLEAESQPIEAGTVVYVPPKGVQWVHNTGDIPLDFLCLVDPAWRREDEEILED